MCGILGVFGCDDILYELINGLTTLQHRGQDAAGIVTFDHAFHVKKGKGLASRVFAEDDCQQLKGNMGLAHIRYSTQGSTDVVDAQPYTVYFPYGLAMVHNGNVTNFQNIKHSLVKDHYRLVETSNDIELLLYTFALELERKNLQDLSVDDIFDTVRNVQTKVQGAYAALTVIANQGMLAFMDPYGIRPLSLGRKETEDGVSFAFASESSCFDYLGYEMIHDLQPGEAIFIDKEKNVHSRVCFRESKKFCVFEYIYFAKVDSVIHGRLVASEREKMGRALAKRFKEQDLQPDIVIDVPSSAFFFAQGLADELGVPYKRGLVKNNFTSRSFISPTQKLREKIVKQKLNPIKEFLRDKKVAIVDDSIVRGTTSKHIVRLIRQSGAREVYFASGSPPLKHPCIYGIDMSSRGEMIAAKKGSLEEIREFLEADALVYLTVDDLRELYEYKGICDACLSGEYPTNVSEEVFSSIEREKERSSR